MAKREYAKVAVGESVFWIEHENCAKFLLRDAHIVGMQGRLGALQMILDFSVLRSDGLGSSRISRYRKEEAQADGSKALAAHYVREDTGKEVRKNPHC